MKTVLVFQKLTVLFKIFFFSLIFSTTSACFKPTGEFGWVLLDEEKFNIIEKKNYDRRGIYDHKKKSDFSGRQNDLLYLSIF